MSFTQRLKSAFGYKPKVNYAADISNPVLINARLLTDHSVTCRCGSMAICTESKGEKYQCIGCGKQLTGSSYNLGLREVNHDSLSLLPKDASHVIDMGFYEDAVNLIKKENKRWL